MSDLMSASIKEQLWHRMRADLVHFAPDIAGNQLLMCCACGRFLPQHEFDLEHLIPEQALKDDPVAVKSNPQTPRNIRAGNLLLCKKRLKFRGQTIYANGCNSWKGKYYDKLIAEMLSGKAWTTKRISEGYVIAGLALGYLAMFSEFGYRVTLLPSGLLMRQQYFSPRGFVRNMPMMSQMLLGGGSFNDAEPEHHIWKKPFSFGFGNLSCQVAMRNFVMQIPISQDPREPIAQHLKIVPSKYKLRPDFTTVFH